MEEKIITCINCPMGCQVTVTLEGGKPVSARGNTCRRGEKYAFQECVEPRRVITAVVRVEGSAVPLSVKTAAPIPKALIDGCMEQILSLRLHAPVRIGDTVLENVCGTGISVVATRNL